MHNPALASLAYQHACDICAATAHQAGGLIALAASSPFYLQELLPRLAHDKVIPVPNSSALLEPLPAQVSVALWAEPQDSDHAQVFHALHHLLLPGGRLAVICSNPLARALPEWQHQDNHPAVQPLGVLRTVRFLWQHHWNITAWYGLQSLSSIAWGYLFKLVYALRRDDLADRCHFQMRAVYVTRGWQALLSPVGLLFATKR